jgi:hypothetical protein
MADIEQMGARLSNVIEYLLMGVDIYVIAVS